GRSTSETKSLSQATKLRPPPTPVNYRKQCKPIPRQPPGISTGGGSRWGPRVSPELLHAQLEEITGLPALLSPVPFVRPHPAANAAGTALAKLYNDYRGKWTGWSPRLAGEESPNSAEQCAG